MRGIQSFIGLGSNLDDSAALLRSALCSLAALPDGELLAVSPFYRSAALSLDDAPGSAQPDYCNAVAGLRYHGSAQDLLEGLLHIEQQHGRLRSPGARWQARRLDLDLLMFGTLQCDSIGLQVPHPHIAHRGFVLRPWADIAPDTQVPGLGSLRSCPGMPEAGALQLWP